MLLRDFNVDHEPFGNPGVTQTRGHAIGDLLLATLQLSFCTMRFVRGLHCRGHVTTAHRVQPRDLGFHLQTTSRSHDCAHFPLVQPHRCKAFTASCHCDGPSDFSDQVVHCVDLHGLSRVIRCIPGARFRTYPTCALNNTSTTRRTASFDGRLSV